MTFNMNAAGAYAAMGYIGGISKTVNTTVYMNSVMEYTHSRLSTFFDMWMDSVARTSPEEYHHVYEWPTGWGEDTPDYEETVGHGAFRLWRHTLTGRGANKAASFEFKPSVRPSPVDPILTDPEGGGKTVKEGVHVFVWKAVAMEYAIDIEVTPKLSRYLAYVWDASKSRQGTDHGAVGHTGDEDDGVGVQFSRGPVEFKAGGGKMHMNFTNAYIYWWQNAAGRDFDAYIRPHLEKGLVYEPGWRDAIRRGNRKNKGMSISALPGRDAQTFNEAKQQAVNDMRRVGRSYINEARARRIKLYGDGGE